MRFLERIYNNIAGTIQMNLPWGDGSYVGIKGFLAEDPNITLSNEFKSVIEDISIINDFTQILNGTSSAWLSTSKQSWSGTAPIKCELNFYLITFMKKQITGIPGTTGEEIPIRKQAAYLARLATVSQGTGLLDVGVHGGYKPNYWQNNQDFLGITSKKGDDGKLTAEAQGLLGQLSQKMDTSSSDYAGTIELQINGRGYTSLRLSRMLLERVNFNPSTVRAGYWDNIDGALNFVKSAEPLFIQVQCSLKGCQTPSEADTNFMWTGSTNLR